MAIKKGLYGVQLWSVATEPNTGGGDLWITTPNQDAQLAARKAIRHVREHHGNRRLAVKVFNISHKGFIDA